MAKEIKCNGSSNLEILDYLGKFWEKGLKPSLRIAYGTKENFINQKMKEILGK